ncbi:MAG: zinc-binding dehydrogenase [Spirochaetales bacterium]|jgi:threonine dehydrogenase-like Zn-dependent dehydrogenase|nr:zinc-binding dehydrogenase [Spirochaetales bacterium]
MKQLIYKNPGNAVLEDAPVPSPGPGQVVVKVLGVTTCPHWDLHMMDGIPMFPGAPLDYPLPPGKPGHEGMGEVVEIGEGVQNLRPGMRVAAWRDTGRIEEPGWYAEYVAFGEEDLLPVSDSFAPEQIASLELAMCVQVSFDTLHQQDLVAGKRFAVAGLGPAGLAAVQMARAYGAKEIVGIDLIEERRETAGNLGADHLVDPSDADALPAERRTASAVDSAIDCTGLKVSIEYLMDRTKDAVCIFGVLREDVVFGSRHWSGLSLIGYGDHNLGAAKRALDLINSGKLDLAPLATRTLPLSDYAEGVELLRQKKAVKVCFIP